MQYLNRLIRCIYPNKRPDVELRTEVVGFGLASRFDVCKQSLKHHRGAISVIPNAREAAIRLPGVIQAEWSVFLLCAGESTGPDYEG
ncbi:hypothetical protein EDC90_100280 [Martelella mediterranea]|uniref:Uncharacterized protein n=1 Tax=Martelella mediterranea TaxID=293089 RepID=A0A4V2V4V6_9HYPH|nr:hypothetical protein EDC90_100280 [Martelella mediterranea]